MNRKMIATAAMALVMAGGVAYGQEGRGGGPLGGPGGRGGMGWGQGGAGQLLQELSDLTGLTFAEIRAGLGEGQTLADLITANGADVAEVTTQIVASVTDRVNAQVAAGRISQERADALLAEVPAMIDELLNSSAPQAMGGAIRERFEMRMEGWDGPYNRLMEELIAVTGLERAEIRAALEAGTSVSAILEENGVELSAFIETLLVPAQERLAEAVTEGRINQAIADARLALMQAELEYRLTLTPWRAR